MKRFLYTLTTTKPGHIFVEGETLERFRQLAAGDNPIATLIRSDRRLDPDAIQQFEARHSVNVLFVDRVANRGQYLLTVADTYPRESLLNLQRLLGEPIL